MIRQLATHPHLLDVAIVAALLADALLPGATLATNPGSLLTAALVAAPLAVRRRYPALAMALSALFYFVRLGLGYPVTSSLDLAQLLAVYTVASLEKRSLVNRVLVVGGIGIAIGFTIAAVTGYATPLKAASATATWAAMAFFGQLMYLRGQYQEALEDRARRAEAEQAERDRRAVQDERARIAREFHDIWAHTLSVVVVQAEAAEEVFDESPELARQALGRIRKAGREALTEVRRLIASDMGTGGSERLTSVPTLGDLGELAEDLRVSGLPVSLSITGPLDRVPGDINLSAYRIVQQALTNALTHGGPAVTAKVDVQVSAEELRIDVVDDGHAVKPPKSEVRQGRGIIGMRERASLFGGTVAAGPEPRGGFGVHARIPLAADR